MANFHDDEWIMKKVEEHYIEALEYFPEDRIVGIFLQGSQNYGLDTEQSDIDTKLIVLPTFEDLAFNRQPISTTHIRENNEHIDFKDLRLMFQTFRKHNLNFIEILFTPYCILNPTYEDLWEQIIRDRETIAHSNPVAAIKSMRGIALEKYHAMEHRYPSKVDIIDKYGYDPKQLHHLIRVGNFLNAFIDGESYINSMTVDGETAEYLKNIKINPEKLGIDLDKARDIANKTLIDIETKCTNYLEKIKDFNPKTSHLCNLTEHILDSVQFFCMRTAIEIELDKFGS